MNWQEVFTIVGSVGAIIGGGFAWMWSRLDKRFDFIDRKFEQVDKRFEHMEHKFEQKIDQLDKKFEQRIDQMDKKFEQKIDQIITKMDQTNFQLSSINMQIAKLETRVEERTLRVIHVEKTGTEEKKLGHTFTIPSKNEE